MTKFIATALVAFAIAGAATTVNAGPLSNSIMVHGNTTSYGQ